MKQTVSVSNPLGTERIGKLMVRFAVPSIIALVLNSLYNMVDQVFIGNGVGYLGNAATNVILPIMTVVLAGFAICRKSKSNYSIPSHSDIFHFSPFQYKYCVLSLL